MLIGLIALAEEFGLARGIDYIWWCEVEGTACFVPFRRARLKIPSHRQRAG